MRFHLPSFLDYFEPLLPYDIGYLHHKHTIYLLTGFPLQTSFLQDLIVKALFRSCESPRGTRSGSESKSVIAGLLDRHRDTLRDTLSGTQTYITCEKETYQERGERRSRYEYRLDLEEIARLFRQVRLQEDVKLATTLIRNEAFVSLRLLQDKLFVRTGQYFSSRRVRAVMDELLAGEHVKNTTSVRTLGRKVMPPKKETRH